MLQSKKLAFSGLVMAAYVAVMFVTQGFAFLQYQIRIATSLYALAAVYPFLIVPLGLANLLSNVLMGGLGPLDMFGGLLAGILTCGCARAIIKTGFNKVFIALPIIFIPGLMVPIWLSYLLKLPYPALALSLCIGQILPGITGVLIYSAVSKLNLKI